jgi:hypothetical protein
MPNAQIKSSLCQHQDSVLYIIVASILQTTLSQLVGYTWMPGNPISPAPLLLLGMYYTPTDSSQGCVCRSRDHQREDIQLAN